MFYLFFAIVYIMVLILPLIYYPAHGRLLIIRIILFPVIGLKGLRECHQLVCTQAEEEAFVVALPKPLQYFTQ